MDNDEQLIVPSPDSHWSLRLVDTKKPFPNQIFANVTYKILRFFYPPISLDVVDLTHVVGNPELNVFNVGLFLSLALVLSYVAYVGLKFFRKAGTPGRTNILLEEPTWLTTSNVSLVEAKDQENDVRFRHKEDRGAPKQDDLAEQIERAVWERPVSKRQPKPKEKA